MNTQIHKCYKYPFCCLAVACFIGICGVIAACSRSEPESEHPDFPWKFVKVAELDTGRDEALLGNLWSSASAIGPDGTVYVVSDAWAGVHEFLLDGNWRRNLGGEGHGPGEFQRVRYVSVSPAGRLAIYDHDGRVSFFERSGDFSGSFKFKINVTFGSRILFAGNTQLWIFTSPPDERIPKSVRSEELILFSAGGDTLRVCLIPNSEPYLVMEHKGTPLITALNPEVGAPKWTVSPDGTAWLLTPSGKQLIRISPETGESDTIAVQLTAPVFTKKQWAQIVKGWTAWMRKAEVINKFVRPITRILKQIRESLSPVQRMWWIDEHGILVDRMPNFGNTSYPEGSWSYAAILNNGSMTEEVEGPAGLITAGNGYALQGKLNPTGPTNLILWKLEPAGG